MLKQLPFTGLSLIMILLLSCKQKQPCYKDFIVNHQFQTFKTQKHNGSRITFKENTQHEEMNGELVLENHLLWESCNVYRLVVKEAYTEGYFTDTIRIEVLSKEKDTLNLLASVRGMDLEMRMYRLR